MQNRMTWVLGAIAAAATVAAVGVGLNGYRNDPPDTKAQVQQASGSGSTQDEDPLTPRFLSQSGSIRIHVAGAVRKPGVYSLPGWYRVDDAVKKAGGATDAADLDRINLADGLRDGEQLRIPVKGAESLQAHQPTPEPAPLQRGAGGRATGRYPFTASASSVRSVSSGPVNLNTAGREELDALPGVGPATADKIIDYRETQGRFLQPEDLMNIQGIGEARFARLRPLIEVR